MVNHPKKRKENKARREKVSTFFYIDGISLSFLLLNRFALAPLTLVQRAFGSRLGHERAEEKSRRVHSFFSTTSETFFVLTIRAIWVSFSIVETKWLCFLHLTSCFYRQFTCLSSICLSRGFGEIIIYYLLLDWELPLVLIIRMDYLVNYNARSCM